MSSLHLDTVDFEAPAVQRLIAEWQEELLAGDPSFAAATGSQVQQGDFSDAHGGVFLLAHVDGEVAGCGGLRRLGPATGEVKRLFVRSTARRHGVGAALLRALEDHARTRGYTRLRLDTGGDAPALALFRSSGFVPIADYNGNRRARHWFEKRL